MDTAVKVSGLRKTYRSAGRAGVLAVDGVDFTVRQGELLVLLGPSGCGKTTLLRSVAGLEVPDEGEVTIGPRTVFSSRSRTNLPPEQRRIGMMFQSYALWPHMTVYQNVAYPLGPSSGTNRAETETRIHDLLDRLGVSGLDHRYPGELSGGQQQRVALARALVASPSVILFDEPLSNVDARVRRRLRALLRELKQQTKFAGIYVTHDQEEAMELADTLAVMDRGTIRQMASSHEVYVRPASLYVAGFVGEINRWEAGVDSVDGASAIVSTGFGKLTIDAAAGRQLSPGARGWLVIRPERVRILRPGTAAAAPDTRSFQGVVRESAYFGSRREVRVDLSGHEVMAWAFDVDSSSTDCAPGRRVDVVLDSAGLRWLSD